MHISTKTPKCFLAGHTGLVGSALYEQIKQQGQYELITCPHKQLDLTCQNEVESFFDTHRPDIVILAAAKVGGIQANRTKTADFIYQNLMIQSNVMHQAHRFGVKKMVFYASACTYPVKAAQPVTEDQMFAGPAEPTNAAYAEAKRAGVIMAQSYAHQHQMNVITIVPANLYGPGDNFNEQDSHVIPALIWKFHKAKQEQAPSVKVWGSGKAIRDFLYVDDLAELTLQLLEKYDSPEPINAGSGEGTPIGNLIETIQQITGYQGRIDFDTSMPDGAPKKVLDCTKLTQLGWKAQTPLHTGLMQTYEWFLRRLKTHENIRK
ncbi:MAG: GDP-L-fucose synthase [Zetaproteobacteria bacterium]|nr:GDP-L-fucose synthase [Zetaproteobacteria bacterium]